MAKRREMTMEQDLRSWGVGLIIMGVLHFFIPFLLPEWGAVIICLGILTLIIRHRFMFIPLGGSLVLVGILNILASVNADGGFWLAFGCLQIYWGFKEGAKYFKYGKLQDVRAEKQPVVNVAKEEETHSVWLCP